jgi:hypothetical protein
LSKKGLVSLLLIDKNIKEVAINNKDLGAK